MGARRVLAEAEPLDATPADSIYRPTSGASQSAGARAARRRVSYDTTTIRPGWESLTSTMTTTIIKTKQATAAPPRKRRLAVIAAAAVATITVAAVSFGFLAPHQVQQPIDVALPVGALVRDLGNTAVNEGLAQDTSMASSLQPVADIAAGALAADTLVKDQLDAANQIAKKAGAMHLAEAQAAWDDAMRRAGTSRVDWANGKRTGNVVPVPDGAFIWPVKFTYIASKFGFRTDPVYGGTEFHMGVDLAAPCKRPVYASGDGVVSFSGWTGGYGNTVEINHGLLSTQYAHNSSNVVTVGQKVQQGDLIAYVGSTGKSTGCHVHMNAINGKGQFFDPMTLIH